jgi:hypothetical protein
MLGSSSSYGGKMGISKSLRQQVLRKCLGCCAYCGDKPRVFHVDHIKPVAHGGLDEYDNLYPSCPSCNNFKNTMTLEEFRNEVSQQVSRARMYSINFRLAERFKLIEITERPIEFWFEYANRTAEVING